VVVAPGPPCCAAGEEPEHDDGAEKEPRLRHGPELYTRPLWRGYGGTPEAARRGHSMDLLYNVPVTVNHLPVTAPPSLESLRCFAEAARLLNFRAAARAVALTPAALGQRIQQLEGQLGRPLFHRSTRRVTLSEAGLALLPHAQRALEAA